MSGSVIASQPRCSKLNDRSEGQVAYASRPLPAHTCRPADTDEGCLLELERQQILAHQPLIDLLIGVRRNEVFGALYQGCTV